ncbi:DUF3592 domain-containing protein [Streptomyces syringium]|uniref:DUF3592 domain-containing protein n=1 Tax=Streptomyces syringium TaxID=76729 RepID=UPI003455D38E
MAQIPSGVVLRGRGVEFRLAHGTVTVVRGRTTWTAPLEAIGEVVRNGATVRIQPAGGGAGDAVTLTTRNSVAADAFVRSLRTALVDVPRVTNGPSLVTTQVRRHLWLRWLDRPGLLKYFLLVAAYLTFAATALYRAAQEEVVPPVHMVLWLGPIGASLVAKSWRDVFRDAAILRRRGITVPGRIVKYDWVSSEEEFRPIYEFQTVEGRTVVAPSSVLVARYLKSPHLDVTYDPEAPHRARGVGRAGGTVRGVLMAFFGTLMTISLAVPVFLVLMPLLPR